MAHELTLYYMSTCPFCLKVLEFMDDNGIGIPVKDRNASAENLQELMKVGGKQQVPCLVINGKAMYESDDIIAWMKKKLL
ncbi:MAG: glutathione S-transferase N-terminal domain-containing protein [Candidatus Omnitrophica bacterium]|nr:glutathione S-transferase N-terminal domain-containing protein [Candidatus Omnitrophota bacterium]